jgi:hypothetical protein
VRFLNFLVRYFTFVTRELVGYDMDAAPAASVIADFQRDIAAMVQLHSQKQNNLLGCF